MKREYKIHCVVCGAQNKNRLQDTCDAICSRAKHSKKTRGKQIEIETRAEWRKPIPVDTLVSQVADELEYNRPYMVDILRDRRND